MHKVFLGFPYSFGKVYRDHVASAIGKVGLDPVVADDTYTGQHIWQNVTEILEDDEVVVALFDITGLNPNVLIEVGFSYGLIHPTVLLLNPAKHFELLGIQQSNIPLPIPEDLAGIQRIHYNSVEELQEILPPYLRQITDEFLGDVEKFRAEVRQFLGRERKATTDIWHHVNAARGLDLSYQTARNWLQEMVFEGILDKQTGKPAYYWVRK